MTKIATLKCILRVDEPTVNGHIYKREVLEKAFEKIKDSGVFGTIAGCVPTLTNVSHVVTGVKILEDGSIDVEIKILDTPMGKNLATMLECGSNFNIVPTGKGKVSESGEISDYALESFDIVGDDK